MKFILVFLGIFLTSLSSWANDNPFFGKDMKQSYGFNTGFGVDTGFIVPPPGPFVPFTIMNFQYSMPNTFFELPGRQSINFAQTLGWGEDRGWDWEDFSIPIIYLSEDFAFFWGKDWYVGSGLGIGFQAHQNDRIGSKLLFQFKLLAGYRFSDKWAGEFIIQHFSNGSTTDQNNSYAFYGLGFTYSF